MPLVRLAGPGKEGANAVTFLVSYRRQPDSPLGVGEPAYVTAGSSRSLDLCRACAKVLAAPLPPTLPRPGEEVWSLLPSPIARLG